MQERALLDSGSAVNCISEDLFNKLKRNGDPSLNTDDRPVLVTSDMTHEMTVLGRTEIRLRWRNHTPDSPMTEKFKFYVIQDVCPDIIIKSQTFKDPKFRMEDCADTWPADCPKLAVRGLFQVPRLTGERKSNNTQKHQAKKKDNARRHDENEENRRQIRKAQREAEQGRFKEDQGRGAPNPRSPVTGRAR